MADHSYPSTQPSTKNDLRGPQCFAFGCFLHKNPSTKAQGVSFHKFPSKDVDRSNYNLWVHNCRRQELPSKWSVLCSKHFEEKWLDRTGQTVRIKDGAVPTIFLLPAHLQPKQVLFRSSKTSNRSLELELENDSAEHIFPQNTDTILQDHNYNCDSPSVYKKRSLDMQDRIDSLQKRLKNTQARERRARQTCQTLIDSLKEKNYLNTELEEKLRVYKDIPCELFEKPHGQYTEEQRHFALTLHMYSPKAYEYLRKNVQLPAPRTLTKWLEKIKAEPGISLCMLQSLKEKVEKFPEQYTHCCVMLDAMAIRKQIIYEKHSQKLVGYVDLGTGNDQDEEVGKEVLVVMAVGFKQKWKAPIAFYVTKGLSAESQTCLLKMCLQKLNECGLIVHALTMDGHATNMGMCRILGCNFEPENMLSYFETPDQTDKIWVILDACHMIKLVRNSLEALKSFKTPTGTVQWKDILTLNDVQNTIGLTAGNKLSNKHVNFQQQKMKVSLAVQTLSNSVAVGLQTAFELGVDGLDACSSTVQFIQYFDKLFDVMNSRSKFVPGMKQAISSNNIGYLTHFFQEVKQYLLSLRTMNGQSLLECRRRTGFLGMIINMKSIIGVAEDLLNTNIHPLEYVCTYKMSQDHLELFFNAVRRMGGWNNNPNVVQFKAAFRRLISHVGASACGETGNVVARDETEFIHAATTWYVPPTTVTEEVEEVNPDVSFYFRRSLDSLVDNILVYISGYIVRKISPKITCNICKLSLVSENPESHNSYILLSLRNKGGLYIPSNGLLCVMKSSEKHIRSLTGLKKSSRKLSSLELQTRVLAEIGNLDIFNFDNHILETSCGISNHYIDLIRLIVDNFYLVRQFHIVKLQNLSEKGDSIRHKLNKTVLFMGH